MSEKTILAQYGIEPLVPTRHDSILGYVERNFKKQHNPYVIRCFENWPRGTTYCRACAASGPSPADAGTCADPFCYNYYIFTEVPR